MSINKYSGKLYYSGVNDYLDISSFILRTNEIAFSLASVSQEHGRWTAESGRPALLQNDGTYLVKGIGASQNGVPAFAPWDISFTIEEFDDGKCLSVRGELIEGGETYYFDGDLDAV